VFSFFALALARHGHRVHELSNVGDGLQPLHELDGTGNPLAVEGVRGVGPELVNHCIAGEIHRRPEDYIMHPPAPHRDPQPGHERQDIALFGTLVGERVQTGPAVDDGGGDVLAQTELALQPLVDLVMQQGARAGDAGTDVLDQLHVVRADRVRPVEVAQELGDRGEIALGPTE